MKVVAKDWLSMTTLERFNSIKKASRQSDVSLKGQEKSLQALACK